MDYLVEATKNWSNLDEMTVNEFRIDANKEVVKISKSYSTYARLPHDSEMPSVNATFLYEYLAYSDVWPQAFAQPTKFVSGIEGYWTDTINSSSIIEDTPIAYGAVLVGYLSTNEITNAISFGVRPVIKISKSAS